MCKYSKLNLNTFARSLLQHSISGTLVSVRYAGCSAAASGRKYSSRVLNTYTFRTQKVGIFAGKNSKITLLIFQLSKVGFKENIKMQSEPKFRGYSMNTLNIYRRRP